MNRQSLRLATALTFFVSNVAWSQTLGLAPTQPAPAAAAARAAAPAPRAALLSFAGAVSILRFGGAAPQTVSSAPITLRVGDKVITSPDASAKLRMADFSEIRLGPGTEFMIAVQKPRVLALFLWTGKLWASVVSDRSRRFEVRAPGAVAAVRGTRFSVEMVDAKTIATEVYEGAVAVDGLKGYKPLGSMTLVLPGQRVEVIGGTPPGQVRTLIAPRAGAAAGAAVNREQVAAELKTALARALAARRVDTETAIKEALDSGDAARMNRIASALKGSSDLDADQKEAVGKAFAEGRPLSEALVPTAAPAAPKPAAAAPAEKPAPAKKDVSMKWTIGREIGLQNEQHFRQFALAQSAAGSTTFGIGGRVSALAAQQPYTRAYFNAQNALSGGVGAPGVLVASASGVGAVSSVQSTLAYTGATSPTYSSPQGTVTLPPVYTPPPQGVGVSCSPVCTGVPPLQVCVQVCN